MRITATKRLHRIALYAVPKTGKTLLATSLPWDTWGDAIYIAADRGSESLASVHPDDVPHLRIEKPMAEGNSQALINEYSALAATDWSKEEGIGTIIWDTMSQSATDLLRAVAKDCRFGDNITFGERGKPGFFANPSPGDFGVTQSAVDHLLGFLFQQKLNVIVLFHADWAMPKGAEGGGVTGGPATVGTAQVKDIGRHFDALLHLEASRAKDGKAQYTVRSTPHGIWQANIRSAIGSMPDTVLSAHPTEFWRAFDKLTRGEK